MSLYPLFSYVTVSWGCNFTFQSWTTMEISPTLLWATD